MTRLICFVERDGQQWCRVVNEATNEVAMMPLFTFRTNFVNKQLASNISTVLGNMICTEGNIEEIARERIIDGRRVISGKKLMVLGVNNDIYKVIGYDGNIQLADKNAIIKVIGMGADFSNVKLRVINGEPSITQTVGKFKKIRLLPKEEALVWRTRFQAGDIVAGYKLGVRCFTNKRYKEAEEILKEIKYAPAQQRTVNLSLFKKYSLKSSLLLYRIEMLKERMNEKPDYQKAWFYLKTSELAWSKNPEDKKKMNKYMRRLERKCLDDREESKQTVAALKDMYGCEEFPLYNIRKYKDMYEREIAISIEVDGENYLLDKMLDKDIEVDDETVELLDMFEALEVNKSIYYRGHMLINTYVNSNEGDIDEIKAVIESLENIGGKEEKEWAIELRKKMKEAIRNKA